MRLRMKSLGVLSDLIHRSRNRTFAEFVVWTPVMVLMVDGDLPCASATTLTWVVCSITRRAAGLFAKFMEAPKSGFAPAL